MAVSQYDLLIHGGTVIDPAQGIHAPLDVAFAGGRVAALASQLPLAQAREAIDASGHLVTPGLIDLHVHAYWGVSHYGIDPDPNFVARGATTVVDAGSAGAATFDAFRRFLIDTAATRIFARLNISAQGMLVDYVGELEDLKWANVPKALEAIERHRDVIVGVKVRLTKGQVTSERAGLQPLFLAIEAAEAAGLPLMVHPQDGWYDSIAQVLDALRPGDLVTHCFHAHRGGVLDGAGNVLPAVRAAVERGVLLDVGHGAGSFSWDVAERALAQGLPPYTISSDLHHHNVAGPVYDLATTVSKFLHLGMPLDDALARVTAAPARSLRLVDPADELGTLRPGACGDAVVFALEDGSFPLVDSHGQQRVAQQRLAPVAVVKGGRRYQPAATSRTRQPS
jgi:dihydroorotase